jgi:hypothetical protein
MRRQPAPASERRLEGNDAVIAVMEGTMIAVRANYGLVD